MSESPVRIGVLALHNSKETKAILNAVEALGHDTEWLRTENTVVRFADGTAEFSPDVDLIVNRLLLSNTEQPAEELGLAHTLAGIRPMLNDPDAVAKAAHKTAAAVNLVKQGIRVPKTALALSNAQLNKLRSEFSGDVVYKTAIGTHGGGVWKVSANDPLTASVGKRRAFLQELIGQERTTPRDLRVYVVGDTVIGAMFRHASESEWRTNVARGGRVEDATDLVSADVLDIARRSMNALGLDYAGVDMIGGGDEWYVLEVNPTAGFRGFYRATGRSPAPYIAQQAIEKAGGDVDPERVTQLSSTLDDSVPSCKPIPFVSDTEEVMTIGFTERAVVSGSSGTKTVIAKSDTGAASTSIDLQLAASIGAGPIHTVSRVRSGSSKQAKSRPVVDLVVGIGGEQYTVAANIEDRTHMTHPLLLGRDILRHYRLDVSRRVEDHSEVSAEE